MRSFIQAGDDIDWPRYRSHSHEAMMGNSTRFSRKLDPSENFRTIISIVFLL